jgi:ketosteroid isomerase-like protein
MQAILSRHEEGAMPKASHRAKRDLGATFASLEQGWGEAIQSKDLAALKKFLERDYALRIADDPGRRISRKEWLAGIAAYNTHSFRIRGLEAREFGGVAVVSQVIHQHADVKGVDRSGDFFIVDIWRRRGKQWKVAARYSAPRNVLPRMPLLADAT